MKPGARMAAAVEVLEDILVRHRPAALALSESGKAHRFAGSGDRAAIGNLVYDALRRRQSLAALMGSDTPRALVIAAAPRAFCIAPEAVAEFADGSPYVLPPLDAAEQAALLGPVPPDTPVHVLGDFPEWLAPSFARAFGDRAAREGEALARRAPVDVRVNTLKATREKVLKALAAYGGAPTPLSPVGVRLPAPEGPARTPNVEAEAGHGKGWYEVQDEGSQLAALLTGAGPRMQVADVCGGSGGKTLALAAQMHNTGQIYAYDDDRLMLRPIFDRLKRAGARNVQVLPAGNEALLAGLGARFDVVLVDAPCTGTGTWRRRPDAKWRLKPQNLADRLAEQRAVLGLAAPLVKPGGRLVYVTCSVLPEENTDQVAWFTTAHAGFAVEPAAEMWRARIGSEPPPSADDREDGLLLTPARHGTDGFFIASLARTG
jgi:16S rRNA (cytosine967-C5)-methyltransferase